MNIMGEEIMSLCQRYVMVEEPAFKSCLNMLRFKDCHAVTKESSSLSLDLEPASSCCRAWSRSRDSPCARSRND